MNPAMRGVVVDGEVWAWPMLLLDHEAAFAIMPHLRTYTCRWRQWKPDGEVDFDPGCTLEDKVLVRSYLAVSAR